MLYIHTYCAIIIAGSALAVKPILGPCAVWSLEMAWTLEQGRSGFKFPIDTYCMVLSISGSYI